MTTASATKPETQRLFFALWPDAGTAEHLAALAEALATSGVKPGARPVPDAQMHMTLRFLGAVSTGQLPALMAAAEQVAAEAEPFTVTLDKLGFWPQGGILYAGCSKTPCRQRRLLDSLSAALTEAGFKADTGFYIPHVTLARRVRGIDLPRLAPMRFEATELALVESQLHPSGARYRTLATWPLAEPECD